MKNIKTISTATFILLSTITSYPMTAVTDINSKVDGTGNTRLHIAAQNGDTTSAKKFIESGANVNLTNNNGATPDRKSVV